MPADLTRDVHTSFEDAEDVRIREAFLGNGYVVAPAEDRVALDRIRDFIATTTAKFLKISEPADPQGFLDRIGEHVNASNLNYLRLAIIDALQATEWFRPTYFACGRRLLERIVGNELAMQRGLGFSLQLPGDETSVLPLHSDAWSEDSPFEVVLWVPFVDVFASKSMFVLSREADARWRTRLHEFSSRSVEDFTNAAQADLTYLDIPYGNVLVFTHTIMHGNRVNREPTARWSINIRFKALFTPYSDKQLGDFFEPITLRPATRIGMSYALPPGFRE
ncbi:MAG TPA: sporadic carbohydrate cluster 2OG-Fe(II) oxygenase [Candidatus Acidoferrales bacterium]|nr:sporadic carbohydrate cluster 2OG-Fe(II) oxygenase [Candidatus Acidoferrales bacterium]